MKKIFLLASAMVLSMGIMMAQEPVKKPAQKQNNAEKIESVKSTKSEVPAQKQCSGKCEKKHECSKNAQFSNEKQCQKACAGKEQPKAVNEQACKKQCQKQCAHKEQPKTAPAKKEVDTKQAVKK